MEEMLDNERWLVFDCHCVAGRPKMEDALMEYARNELLYKIIYRKDFDGIVTLLNKKQQELCADNKHLKPVEIGYLYGTGTVRWIYIGYQTIHLCKIEGEFSL